MLEVRQEGLAASLQRLYLMLCPITHSLPYCSVSLELLRMTCGSCNNWAWTYLNRSFHRWIHTLRCAQIQKGCKVENTLLGALQIVENVVTRTE